MRACLQNEKIRCYTFIIKKIPASLFFRWWKGLSMTTHRDQKGSKEPIIREKWNHEMGLIPYEMKDSLNEHGVNLPTPGFYMPTPILHISRTACWVFICCRWLSCHCKVQGIVEEVSNNNCPYSLWRTITHGPNDIKHSF